MNYNNIITIFDDFPYLTKEDIPACLKYAADREQITEIIVKHETAA